MTKRFHVLRIRSREEFIWLIDHLTTETYRAHDHWGFCGDLEASFDEYSEELNQSPQFWHLTRTAHQDSVILRLGRLFDPTSKALSLGNFLCTIHQAAANGSSYLGFELAEVNLAEIEQEMSSISRDDALVASLLTIRNQYLAHREAGLVGKGTFDSLPKLYRGDIEALLGGALSIAIKYRELFGRPILAWGRPGAGDYQTLLRLLKSGFTVHRGGLP
jgi:hypothetical protein